MVTLEEAKDHMRVTFPDDDAGILKMIDAAVDHLQSIDVDMTVDPLPPAIHHAVLLLVAHFFSNREVMKQFLLEGTCFGLIAGLIGLGLSFLIGSALSSWLLSQTETLKDTSDSAALSPTIMLAGVGIAVVCGALGSLYPAWRAAHVSPMEALRHG